jgi:glucose/arabinose dehydrogenase
LGGGSSNGDETIYATGVRNPTGLAFEPTTGKLWAVANERDEIGPDLVPDYLSSVQENGFYGWPYSYWGQHVDIRVQPQRPDLVAQTIRPDYSLASHVAPLGMMFSQTNSLPAQYQSGVLSANMAAGTAIRRSATRWCSCRSVTGARAARPRTL